MKNIALRSSAAIFLLLTACESDRNGSHASIDSSTFNDASSDSSVDGGGVDASSLEDGSDGSTDIEIAGSWKTPFANGDDDSVVISNLSWSEPFLKVGVVEFDNEANVAITQNPSDSPEGVMPNLYNRVVWTEPAADGFSYCITDFNLQTLDEARASTATADPNDLESGCGGFSWTTLSAQ